VVNEIRDSSRLLRPQLTPELEGRDGWLGAIVDDINRAVEECEQVRDLLGEATRHVEPFEVFAIGADEAGSVPGGEPHALLLVELRVRDRRQVLQPGDYRRRQPRPFDRQLGTQPGPDHRGRRRAAGFGQVRQRQRRSGVDRSERLGQRLHGIGCHAGNRRQERPLVGPRLHRRGIEEQGCARRRAAAVERKGDQVPEPGLGHEVLGREEPVVARQVQLRPCRHRMAQQRRPHRPG